MSTTILYILWSVVLVSLISFVGVFSLWLRIEKLRTIVIYLVALAAGALIGDVFLHLLPEYLAENTFDQHSAWYIIAGIVFGLVLEKIIHRRHCHLPTTKAHPHPFAYMNLIGDMVHNFIDGIIIAASYFVSIEVGIATTIAVILHEIPQEIGDFGVLIHGWFSKGKALLVNFITALSAVVGAILAIVAQNRVENIHHVLIPVAIGSFLYIAGSDLIPEMHKETGAKSATIQIVFFLLGVGAMAALMVFEPQGH